MKLGKKSVFFLSEKYEKLRILSARAYGTFRFKNLEEKADKMLRNNTVVPLRYHG